MTFALLALLACSSSERIEIEWYKVDTMFGQSGWESDGFHGDSPLLEEPPVSVTLTKSGYVGDSLVTMSTPMSGWFTLYQDGTWLYDGDCLMEFNSELYGIVRVEEAYLLIGVETSR